MLGALNPPRVSEPGIPTMQGWYSSAPPPPQLPYRQRGPEPGLEMARSAVLAPGRQ